MNRMYFCEECRFATDDSLDRLTHERETGHAVVEQPLGLLNNTMPRMMKALKNALRQGGRP